MFQFNKEKNYTLASNSGLREILERIDREDKEREEKEKRENININKETKN